MFGLISRLRRGGVTLRSQGGHSDIIDLKLSDQEFSMSTKASIASGENFLHIPANVNTHSG
jgi:hypothetical protein